MATRGKRGEGSVFQRADGMWVAKFPLPRGADGKPRSWVQYAPDENAADELRAKMRRQVLRDRNVQTSAPTVSQWGEAFVASRRTKGKVAASTIDGYESDLRRFIIPTLGRVRIDKITPAHIERLHAAVADKGLSNTTARKAHMALSAMLTDAYKSGLVAENVAHRVDAPEKDYYEGTALSVGESVRLLDWSLGKDYHSLRIPLALLTGPRAGEALGLTRGAVRLDDNAIDYVWQLQRLRPGTEPPKSRRRHRVTGNFWLIELKRGSRRYGVPLLPRVRAELEAAIARMDNEGRTDPMDLLFTRERGGPVSHEHDWQMWSEALTEAGIAHIRRHDSRHTAATLLRQAGVESRVNRAILGHTSALVNEHYAHLGPREKSEAADLLGGLLTSAKKD